MGPLLIPPPADPEQSALKANRRSAFGWVIPLVMIAIVAFFLGRPILRFLYYQSGLERYLHQERFDTNAWRNHTLQGNPMWPTRLRMVDDLLKRHLLDGRSREEVEGLLGPALHTTLFPDWDLAYRLGPERSFIRIDSEWLVVRLDSSGRVREYRLTVD
jgi:hypothetical protein